MNAISLPLPKSANNAKRAFPTLNNANAGLAFNKFVKGWHWKDSKFGLHDGKIEFIKKFTAREIGIEDELERHSGRVKALAKSCRKDSDPAPKHMSNTSRFVTGMGLPHGLENGFHWHHTLGVPYLPASGIKGMMRAWATNWEEEEEEALRLFGNAPLVEPVRMGALIVFDALPVKPVKLVAEIMTPHDGGWRTDGPKKEKNAKFPLSPGDWHNPVPIPFLAVEEKNEFLFALGKTRNAKKDDLKKGYDFLCKALEWIGFGAKTAIGMGRFMSASAIKRHKQDAEMQMAKIEELQAEFQKTFINQYESSLPNYRKGAFARISTEATKIKKKHRGKIVTLVAESPEISGLWGFVYGMKQDVEGIANPVEYLPENDLLPITRQQAKQG